MELKYEVLLKVDSNKVNGFSLLELIQAFPNMTSPKIDSAIDEMEFIGVFKYEWVLNKNHQWEKRWFTTGEGTLDFIKFLKENKLVKIGASN